MKRVPIALLTAALLGALAGRAPAAPLETSGEMRVRAWVLEDYSRDEQSAAFWDQRLRLTAVWPIAETVRIHVRADILEGPWGEDTPVAGPGPTGETPIGAPAPAAPVPGAPARQQVAIDQANLQFVWPGTPVKLSIGRQEVSWGTGYWVQADDRDRFQVAAKLDPVIVVVAYDKFTEVYTAHETLDDWRAWAIGAVTDAAGFKLGLLVAYMQDESRFRFPKGDVGYLAGDFFANGRIGPVSLKAEGVAGGGTLERDDGTDLDLAGLGWYAGAFLPVGRALTLGLEGAYARGDDPATPDKNEGFFSADYQGPYWSVIFYNNLDHPGYAADVQTSDAERDFSVRNAVTGKLSATVTPSKNLEVTLAALYAAADRVPSGVDKALGWEFDLLAAYRITGNVTLSAGVGYALLGDYWLTAPVAAGSGARPDNPLGAVVAVTTRF